MVLLAELRKRARAVAGPVLGAALALYFGYHLVQGERGLLAWLRLTQQLKDDRQTLEQVRGDRVRLDQRVGLLRPEQLDRDMLDERARAVLNLAGPNEIVILNNPR